MEYPPVGQVRLWDVERQAMSDTLIGPRQVGFGAAGRLVGIAYQAHSVLVWGAVPPDEVLNGVHQSLCDAAMGDEAVYVNDNPQDSRTTEVCMEASRQDPMTLEQWSASRWGRPPRWS